VTIWGRDHEDITGLHYGEVDICRAEPPYPSFVHMEIEPGSVLADDARAYALLLLAAAEAADAETDRAFEAAGYRRSREGEE